MTRLSGAGEPRSALAVLSRPGALLKGTLCQSQRSTLAFRHATGPGSVGRSDHGAAVSHGTCSLQAVLCQQTPSPKTLLDWARQVVLQIHRWLPNRSIVLVADSAFAAIEFLAAVRNHVCVVTRLRLDANLFAFPPAKRKGRGRPSLKGKPLKKLAAVLRDRRVSWQ